VNNNSAFSFIIFRKIGWALPAAFSSILPIDFPAMTHGAHFYFLESIVNGVQHPISAYPYSISLAAPKFFGARGPGVSS